MTRTRLPFVAALTLALLVVPATTGAAVTQLLSGVVGAADVNEDNFIPASFPDKNGARDCIYNPCSEYEGLTFVDVDISEEMTGVRGPTQFTVRDVSPASSETVWFVCAYMEHGNPNCHHDFAKGNGLQSSLSPEARELRLFPLDTAATEYWLDIDHR